MPKRIAASGFVPLTSRSHATPPRTAKIPVLIVAWPPCRDNGPWFLELRAPRDAITAKIIAPPIAWLDDPRAETLAEQFIRERLPKTAEWQAMLYPGWVVASEALIPKTPTDYYGTKLELALLTELRQCQ